MIGHVANSVHTVIGESMSAGRLYDRIGKKAVGEVKIVMDHGVLCKICKKKRLEGLWYVESIERYEDERPQQMLAGVFFAL